MVILEYYCGIVLKGLFFTAVPFAFYLQETESEDDILDEGDDDVEDEHDYEPEVTVQSQPVVKPAVVPASTKETVRQLSKKERKKKELAELEALLADFGIVQKDSNDHDGSHGKLHKFVSVENCKKILRT